MYARSQTESSADQTAIVIDYRDLLQIGAGKADPEATVKHELNRLMQAGVNGAVVYESTLEEFGWAGETEVYSAAEAAALQGRVPDKNDNRTYVLFLNPDHAAEIEGIVREGFEAHGVTVSDWAMDGRKGVILDIGKDDAMLRPMQPNPIEIRQLRDLGLWVVPRLSDRFEPFNAERLDAWLKSFKAAGIDRITFDGDAVPGFSEESPGPGKPDGVQRFAYMLQNNGIGIASFENLKTPVQGLGKLAKLIDYNVIRAHSVTDQEMAVIKTDALEDRILLAVKDRNIRMVFLNAIPSRDALKGKLTNPLDTIVDALQGEKVESGQAAGGAAEGENHGLSGGAVQGLKHFGFTFGVPHAFQVHHAPAETLLRGLAMLGGIALVSIVVGMFLPSLIALAFAAGVVGGAGLYVLKPTLMVQSLALFAAIAAPTAAVILLVRRLRANRSDGLSAGRRLGSAVLLYLRTALLSMAAIPIVVALLNHISYNLVLQQFRGVSLLHAAPIALAAVYVFLYGPGGSVIGNARRILMTPITVFWIAAIGVLGAAGLYYMSRTGNAGTVSGIELTFRSLLENTFGVRPRTKEFLLGHPIMLAGIFLTLRYRYASFLLVLGTIAQLSMVDTFAHIHTPLALSIARVLLGLGLGLLIGLVLIAVWQVGERIWKRFGLGELREAK
ncbi:DUF5693 family protein [Cohnella sp. CFH 77786]|uniref:DUF5693 family protein n=1 Tax=Cohnella sp. CFH 77786 TaxID=2662265 RepID=UPI0021042380|nr:DUF5693 family protein [Cohnella sp. CFH 77786]